MALAGLKAATLVYTKGLAIEISTTRKVRFELPRHLPAHAPQLQHRMQMCACISVHFAGVSESSRKGGAESLIAGLGCTHPDSNRRAELLQQELAWMAANREEAKDAVGSKVNYWSL
jgi:hypothetical protein